MDAILNGVMQAGQNALATMAQLATWQINVNTALNTLRVQADVVGEEFSTAIGIGETYAKLAAQALGKILDVDKTENQNLMTMSA